MIEAPAAVRSVLVTGAGGLVGRQVVRLLAGEDRIERVAALDLRKPTDSERLPAVAYETGDIRNPGIAEIFASHAVDAVVHLAAVVTAGRASSREIEYSIDVLGTRNVVEACIGVGVRHLVYTSSGAAYGYHADNPQPLSESDPLRGNERFAYAYHKRLTEELLAETRRTHPELRQLVLRPGTILGAGVRSPISALFERRIVIGVRGSDSPFVLVWDEDVARCIVDALVQGRTGIYNLCGDGAITLPEIARRLGKAYVPIPAPLLAAFLGLLATLRLTSRGAEQVDFLRYRPVLGNERLKRELGFTPRFTSEECFEEYRRRRVA